MSRDLYSEPPRPNACQAFQIECGGVVRHISRDVFQNLAASVISPQRPGRGMEPRPARYPSRWLTDGVAGVQGLQTDAPTRTTSTETLPPLGGSSAIYLSPNERESASPIWPSRTHTCRDLLGRNLRLFAPYDRQSQAALTRRSGPFRAVRTGRTRPQRPPTPARLTHIRWILGHHWRKAHHHRPCQGTPPPLPTQAARQRAFGSADP